MQSAEERNALGKIQIDWFYFRVGCKSCERTREALNRKGAVVRSERNARKAPMTEEEVGRLLSSLEEVILVRGRAFEVRAASRTSPQDLRGPTGNFRAPLLRRGG